ncbi:MAG TPA: ribosomal protein L7/L12 [Steroidobacteraceae bacterium]|nr:ribosomal protein L7/L12 [Steroidobacteraceae bacterium]
MNPSDVQLSGPAMRAVQAGHKIEAIKLVREATGLGLKEAKQAVEAYQAQHGIVLSTQPSGSAALSLFSWLFAIMMGIVAIVYFWPE